MPKIVDHEKFKIELAEKAVKVFREYGYSGLGMRKIAEELNISKSALYHYFPTKDVLFAECTKLATSIEHLDFPEPSLQEMSVSDRIKNLILVFQSLEEDFKGEMSIVIDYIRFLTPSQISTDKNMQQAKHNHVAMVASFVGKKNAQLVLCIMYGILLQRLFDGREYSFQEIEEKLVYFIENE